MKRYIGLILLIAVFSSADTLFLQPGPEGKDAAIYDEDPNINYGDISAFYIGIQEYFGETRTLIDWDISELPEGAEIASATMAIFCSFAPDQTTPTRFYSVIETWEEDAVTWNNQPTHDTAEWTAGETSETDRWTYFDVTDFVGSWYSGAVANYGLKGIAVYEGYTINFWSSDYDDDETLRPKLTIEYTPADAAVKPSSLGAVKAAYR